MRIGIVSDMHFEFGGWSQDVLPDDLDVLVNAGDTHPSREVRAQVERAFTEKLGCQYFEVLGNHDFYGDHFPFPGENQRLARIGGLLFAGATLWTAMSPGDWEEYSERVADRANIPGSNPLAYHSAHASDLNFLVKSGADVFVTHHSPSRTGDLKFAGSSLSKFFHNSLEDVILTMKKPPRLWVHGHSHERADYCIGSTRVVSHPRGYPHEADSYDRYNVKVVEI